MPTDHRSLIYEWSNYRYCSSYANSRKGRKDVLDPYTVESEWFQILYPSLQLVLTSAVPDKERERALRTIVELGLRDGESLLRIRRIWLVMYQAGNMSLEGLRKFAPLIASMVEREGLPPSGTRRPSE